MATTTESSASSPGTYKLELATAYGPAYRDVLKTPPRDCDPSEVPVIDLSGLDGDDDDDDGDPAAKRAALAAAVRAAAENTGFFYVRNHGVPAAAVDAALAQARAFFAQAESAKRGVATARSRFFNGWTARRGSRISPTESRDDREGFAWRYDPRYDPARGSGKGGEDDEEENEDDIPEDVRRWLRGEEFVWEGTAHLPGFKADVLAYWQACLTLARRLVRVFALALDLPEAYFDDVVTFPGADGVFNYYPRSEEREEEVEEKGEGEAPGGGDPEAEAGAGADVDVGLGAHTDMQLFTLLWQDDVGGLQVLRRDGQWLRVPPVAGTFVVNIGDFLQRLSNDRFRSTVHRVLKNRAPVDRYSMPFFFGFNFNERCGVLPSCTSADNPPKYEPITCGEVSRIGPGVSSVLAWAVVVIALLTGVGSGAS